MNVAETQGVQYFSYAALESVLHWGSNGCVDSFPGQDDRAVDALTTTNPLESLSQNFQLVELHELVERRNEHCITRRLASL